MQRRMLLVENDHIQRDKAADVLRRRGWDLETAENGKDALPKVQAVDRTYDFFTPFECPRSKIHLT